MSDAIQTATPNFNSPLDNLCDVQEILVMLALALAVIAAPATQPFVSKVLATVAQHTAMAWAEVLGGIIELQGGDL